MTDIGNQQVGFVGLGDQGGPMAVAIVEAGFLLHAWARRPQSYDALGVAAFERHDDLASLARAVDVLALCATIRTFAVSSSNRACSMPFGPVRQW
jgi:3-hydroxyisobutyrate dehydrogenase-like beta-hydroxyacid dehydrogenase